MRFLITPDSLVEFATVPASLACLVLGRASIHLRCLRFLRLTTAPQILQVIWENRII